MKTVVDVCVYGEQSYGALRGRSLAQPQVRVRREAVHIQKFWIDLVLASQMPGAGHDIVR